MIQFWSDCAVLQQHMPQGTEDDIEKVRSHIWTKDILIIKKVECPHACKSE
jgi:hypothetical protein